MKKILFLVLILFLLPINTSAQVYNVGLGTYGIQSEHWKCDAMIRSLKPVNQIHIAFLYKTFGMNNECLYRIMSDPRFKSLEIHLTNGAGLRKPVRRWYEVLAGESVASLNRKLEARDKKILRIFKRELNEVNTNIISKLRSDQACFISPILEHNLSNTATYNLMSFLKPIIPPNCLLVNNPMGAGNGDTMGADLYERHGSSQYSCSWCINDLDGEDISFDVRKGMPENHIHDYQLPDFIMSHRDLVANFLWIREMNGWDTASFSAAFEDPRERTNFPQKWLFDLVVQYIVQAENTFEIPPYTKKHAKSLEGCETVTKVTKTGPSGFLWKRLLRDVRDLTSIRFGAKYMEPFQSVVVQYKGKVMTEFKFDKIDENGQQIWIVETPLYAFPYHIVVRVNDTMCYKIRNPRIKNGRR